MTSQGFTSLTSAPIHPPIRRAATTFAVRKVDGGLEIDSETGA
jgi:hypothetical protein